MEKNSESEGNIVNTEPYLEQWRLCLNHAGDLIASAERVLADDDGFPNIAYHLAILSMEEIGKAGLLSARGVTKGAWDSTWVDKQLDNHVQKFMWAVWSPSLSGGKIDPKDFEDARRFAESTHQRRMAGLYVDYSEDSSLAPPRDAVRLDQATSLLNLAKGRLELEKAHGAPIADEGAEELQWFLATVGDQLKRKRLFSASFIKKHEELNGDSRAWARWARDEFAKIDAEAKEHLQRELSRQASEPGKGKPKWLMKVRLQTPSHSLRQKTLNYWNERINTAKLRTAGPKGNDLLLELTINDHVTIEQLFDFGLSFSKLHLVMLNIGTAGFFWYELSDQAEAYYESIVDLEAPNMNVVIGRRSGLPREWMEERSDGVRRQRVSLEEMHLETAMMGLAVFGSIPNDEAEPIFGPYLRGLVLLSKADVHLSIEAQARDAFVTTLRRAMRRFGDLETEQAPLLPALHRVMQPVIPDVAHRNKVFGGLEKVVNEASVSETVDAKRAADLYLAIVARRLWPEFVKRVNDPEQPPQA
jgi:AbiV family abortive infection protein